MRAAAPGRRGERRLGLLVAFNRGARSIMIESLLSTALLGTRGTPPTLVAMPADVAEMLSANPEADAEAQLLDAVAALCLYARAGARPRRGVSTPEPVPPDERPVCTPRAAALLAAALDSDSRGHLAEWLELAAVRGCRPPAHLLPKLLDLAAARREIQSAVAAVIDLRGRWLLQFNPRWQFTALPAEEPEETWQVGTKPQRADLLRGLRLRPRTRPRAGRIDLERRRGRRARSGSLSLPPD